jgi:hypothetical protein
MPKKKHAKRKSANPDFRARSQVPAPPVAAIAQRLRAMLTPAAFAPLRHAQGTVKRRDRLLTLPVMVAIVVSLVWRQIPSLRELLRVLALEGLLWTDALTVSKQALSKRLANLPASLFADLFADVVQYPHPVAVAAPGALAGLAKRFAAIWLADGSTLEALRRKLKALRQQPDSPLAGKMMMVVEGLTRRPRNAFYSDQANANDKRFGDELLLALPVGGLVVVDLGFFSFALFDKFTQAQKYFVTRQREKTAYKTVRVLNQQAHYRDEIIEMGQYRSNPCRQAVRMVSVLWHGQWYRYLTNVLDDQQLRAREVCELYQSRWRIEEAFLLTKRLLGLSYLWVGGKNGVEIQVYATWIFYTVLTDVCVQVGQALSQPVEKISVEMVFRSLYHYSRALEGDEEVELLSFLVTHAKLLDLVKAQRKRHRERAAENLKVWGEP